ncbi:MAG: leucyl aminopeptidase [Actinobacteria bacterium HGW-Actinobacteria-4]|nr:MAG: leucyl aminopeptidase [Actinobacteria bacterium HGW-Actinobacteria-4]
MTSLDLTTDTASTIDADALIVGLSGTGEVAAHPQLPNETAALLGAAAKALDASSKVGKVTVVPGQGTSAKRVVLVGLGQATTGELREAAGCAARSCGKEPSTVVIAIPADDDEQYAAIGEGALLGAYRFTDYKSEDDKGDDAPEDDGTSWLLAGASASAVERAKVIAGAVAGTRDLINTPPLDLFPASFAEIAEGYARSLGVDAQTWDVQKLAEDGFGGILAVGMGSSRLPRLVRLEWKPEGAKQTVALVGKGITFDSGGLSLKPPKSMETMKSDMSGAAAVLHIVLAAARANLQIGVTGWLCLAENMPSGTASRPSDVIRIYGGKSVEVLNTDAEGRLVLADGLVRAIEEQPDVVLDIATLTGAQGIALGSRTSGVMGSPDIRDEVIAAADHVDESMWPMPLPEYLLETLDSKVADLKNIGDGQAGMLSAAVFLKEFVGDAKWAHLDIARPAFNEGGAYGFTVPGGTGASVRTVLRFLENRANA